MTQEDDDDDGQLMVCSFYIIDYSLLTKYSPGPLHFPVTSVVERTPSTAIEGQRRPAQGATVTFKVRDRSRFPYLTINSH
jgi:hypothetical protein